MKEPVTQNNNHSVLGQFVNWLLVSPWRLLGVLFIVLALPVFGALVVIETEVERQLEQRIVEQNNHLRAAKSKLVQERFNSLVKAAEAASQERDFIEMVQKRGPRSQVAQELKDIVDHYAMIDFAYVSDTNGILLYNYPIDTTVYDSSFAHRDWFKGVAKGGSTYVSEIYQRAAAGKRFVVNVVTPIYAPDSKQKVGYLGVQYPLKEILKLLIRAQVREFTRLNLIDHSGNLTILNEERRRLVNVSDFPSLQQLTQGEGAQKMTDPLRSEYCLMSYSKVAPMGWTLFTSYPLDKIRSPIYKLEVFIAGLFLVCFIIVFGLVFLLFNRVRLYHQVHVKSRQEVDQLNNQLQEKVDELGVLNKELKAFTYSVSHDLKAPLRAIHGYSKILLEDYKNKMPDEVNELLEIIDQNTARMNQLIQDLLKFSRIGRKEIKREPLDMNSMVQEVIQEQQENWSHASNITVKELPSTKGDKRMLRQVWANLIANALKYTSKTEDPGIEVGTLNKDKRTVYYVSDNGAGFDMDYSHKLFQVFQRLHARTQFEGTGVGLALVKRVIKKHGGEVWAEAEKGKGATFYFYLSNEQ